MNTKHLDVVYPIRPLTSDETPETSHEELRYSLRSLTNLPHRPPHRTRSAATSPQEGTPP